jgi:capsular exopolysaccharide synthesis family protein
VELRDYLNVIRARKWVIIQAVVVVTLAAVVVSLLQPPVYVGEAKVLIAAQDTGAAILGNALSDLTNSPERGLQTQVQLIQLRPLAEVAIRKLDLRMTPNQLLQRLDVAAAGQTNVVVIKATDSSPKRAADIANAIALAYVDWSRDTKRQSIKAAADEVQVRLDQAQEQILALGRKINSAFDKEKAATEVQAELTIATGLYSTLAERLEQLRVNEQLEVGSGTIVSPAVPDPNPVSPQPVRNGILALGIGLFFGIGMAFLYEYLDDTIKSTDQAEKLYGAPVLGHIPSEAFEKGESRRLTIVQHPGSPAAEAYRVLRNSLDFVNFEHDIKTLLVTSAAPGEGKSTVAANLAAGLAQAGAKVALVSCDFRRPTTDQFFGVNNSIGLADVLMGSHTLKAALQRPGDDSLLVLTSGRMPPNPSELLGSSKMAELISNLEEWADWIIVDSPPLLAVADAAAAARWADGVLMVTRGGSSTREAARKSREMLEKVGARIAGVVVWGLTDSASGRGYGYYDSRYHGYYYADYYAQPSESPAGRKAGKAGAAGAGGVAAASVSTDQELYIPAKSPGRRFAEVLGRVMTGVLAFLIVVVFILVIIYLLDGYFGWGLIARVAALLP